MGRGLGRGRDAGGSNRSGEAHVARPGESRSRSWKVRSVHQAAGDVAIRETWRGRGRVGAIAGRCGACIRLPGTSRYGRRGYFRLHPCGSFFSRSLYVFRLIRGYFCLCLRACAVSTDFGACTSRTQSPKK